MRFEPHLQQQIPRWRAAHARRTLAGQSNHLPLAHAPGNPHVEGTGLQRDSTLGIQFGHAQADLASGAVESIFQVEQDLGMVILAVRLETASMNIRVMGATHAAEQFGEKVAEVGRFG